MLELGAARGKDLSLKLIGWQRIPELQGFKLNPTAGSHFPTLTAKIYNGRKK